MYFSGAVITIEPTNLTALLAMFNPGHKPAHKGHIVTTDPIRGDDIRRVRDYLRHRPRDLAIWSVGTNCAMRAGDLLALQWSDLEDFAGRFSILLREQKTAKVRRIVLNPIASADLRAWQALSNSAYVFSGQRGPLTVAALGRMLKAIAKEAGVTAQRVSTHSLRKTWVRAQHEIHKVPLYILSQALGHASEAQTRVYMGLLADGVAEAYDNVIA